MTDTYERCSCGDCPFGTPRDRAKCSKESLMGSGKMCLKEAKAEQTIKGWSEEFAKNQETLPAELQQVLADNIWELYEK